MAIGNALIDTGILPDFITVDGGEGGSGAVPVSALVHNPKSGILRVNRFAVWRYPHQNEVSPDQGTLQCY
jgi:hypothetical protein